MSILLKGYFAEKDTVFIDSGEIPMKITLGDERVPYGLWKAIEHMRKKEKSLVMVKPKWGYGRPETKDKMNYPEGWDTPEKREIL